MATLKNVITGLQVFAKYGDDKHTVCAEHDTLYAGPGDDVDLTDEDKKTLDAAGWRYDKSTDSWKTFV